MFETLKTAAGFIRDESLNAELNGLIVKNRRINHASGGNDDLIFAWLLANWMLTYGKNLKHYGIDPVVVKRSVYEHAAGHDPIKRRAIREQEEYRNELIELLNSSPRMNDLFSAQRRRDKLPYGSSLDGAWCLLWISGAGCGYETGYIESTGYEILCSDEFI